MKTHLHGGRMGQASEGESVKVIVPGATLGPPSLDSRTARDRAYIVCGHTGTDAFDVRASL